MLIYRKKRLEQMGFSDVDANNKPISFQETFEVKRSNHVQELQQKEDEMRQMFVVRVKEKEAELKEAEKEVSRHFCSHSVTGSIHFSYTPNSISWRKTTRKTKRKSRRRVKSSKTKWWNLTGGKRNTSKWDRAAITLWLWGKVRRSNFALLASFFLLPLKNQKFF